MATHLLAIFASSIALLVCILIGSIPWIGWLPAYFALSALPKLGFWCVPGWWQQKLSGNTVFVDLFFAAALFYIGVGDFSEHFDVYAKTRCDFGTCRQVPTTHLEEMEAKRMILATQAGIALLISLLSWLVAIAFFRPVPKTVFDSSRIKAGPH